MWNCRQVLLAMNVYDSTLPQNWFPQPSLHLGVRLCSGESRGGVCWVWRNPLGFPSLIKSPLSVMLNCQRILFLWFIVVYNFPRWRPSRCRVCVNRRLCVCLSVYPHDISKTDAARITRLLIIVPVVKVKASHSRCQALGPELIPVYRQSARRWL